MIRSFLALLDAYILGSIPFGLLFTRAAGLGDVRAIGSGNIGATNVLRAGNKWLAIATLLMDFLKGYIATRVGEYLGAMDGLAAPVMFGSALMAVLGHVFPVWLNFKGGKGVATALGTFVGVCPGFALLLMALWLGVFIRRRTVSLASIASFGAAPFIALLWPTAFHGIGYGWAILCLSLSVLVIWRHKSNIERLKNGTEPRFTR